MQSNSGQIASLGNVPLYAQQPNASGHFDILLNTLWFNAGVQYTLNVSDNAEVISVTAK
ncbi:MAG: hypothetical protein IPM92_17145 [Saprospiraceae bacterium]|nr:hypothetical protein [Saprospiraceae bacterium]